METEDATKKLNRELSRLISEYQKTTEVAIENISVDWHEEMGGRFLFHKLDIHGKSYCQ